MNTNKVPQISLFIGFIALRIADIVITNYALSLGAIELNPFGFNPFSLYLSVSFMICIGLLIVLSRDKMINGAISIGLIILIGFYSFVVSHNILEVIIV